MEIVIVISSMIIFLLVVVLCQYSYYKHTKEAECRRVVMISKHGIQSTCTHYADQFSDEHYEKQVY